MSAICPRCGHVMNEELSEAPINGMMVKGCSYCGGFLADYESAGEAVAMADPDEEVIFDKNEELASDASDALTGICPECGGSFSSVPLEFEASKQTVYLDQCNNCKGIWFDKGELKKIFDLALQEAVASGSFGGDSDDLSGTTAIEFHCPRCNRHVHGTAGSLLELDVKKCGECSGIWVSNGQIDQAIGDVRNMPVSAEISAEVKSDDIGSTAVSGKCPDCNLPLSQWDNLPANIKDLYIDYCPECGGLWFDKGEFKSFFRIFNDSPFISAK